MQTICIVDGTYFVNYAAHSSTSNLTGPDGARTGAAYVFLNIMWKLREQGSLVVVFDDIGARAKFRRELYSDYKLKPEKEDNEQNRIISEKKEYAFAILDELLPVMGIPTIRIEEEEADDVIFMLVKGLCDKYSVYVATGDEDYVQMVNLGARVYMYRKDEYITIDNFVGNYGFTPDRFTIYKSLKGDTSDMIKGVPGIGEVYAKKIVQSLEGNDMGAVIKWCEDRTDKQKRSVDDNLRILKRNMLLIDLNNARLDGNLVDKAYSIAVRRAQYDVNAMSAIFDKCGFRTMGKWQTIAR